MSKIKIRTQYALVGSDFSQQEPRLLSNYSKDDSMINAYKNGRDLYSTIATEVYHNKYEDNLEHNPDGSINEQGKKRRSSVKGLLLGIMYGMGVASIADSINGTVEEAQKILDNFYQSYPKVKKWITQTEEFAKKYGYVEDWYGRRRRLPNILLPEYEVMRELSKNSNLPSDFNPFLGCSYRVSKDELVDKYKEKCKKIKSYKGYNNLRLEAQKEGITIKANTSLIAEATRQSVNARIQGGAATMTKVAMNKLYRDNQLNDWKFHMMIGVHDELIGECPKYYSEQVADRLTYIMKTCIQDYCVTPFKCDADITSHWYESEYNSHIQDEFKNMLKDYSTREEAINALYEEHSESSKEYLDKVIKEIK